MFKNIKFLDIMQPTIKSTGLGVGLNYKINLPKLETIKIKDISQLNYFIDLKLLRNIETINWDKIITFDGIFDPKEIFELKII